jgi:hypothetical protein
VEARRRSAGGSHGSGRKLGSGRGTAPEVCRATVSVLMFTVQAGEARSGGTTVADELSMAAMAVALSHGELSE